jgi:hypothetical protein
MMPLELTGDEITDIAIRFFVNGFLKGLDRLLITNFLKGDSGIHSCL